MRRAGSAPNRESPSDEHRPPERPEARNLLCLIVEEVLRASGEHQPMQRVLGCEMDATVGTPRDSPLPDGTSEIEIVTPADPAGAQRHAGRPAQCRDKLRRERVRRPPDEWFARHEQTVWITG